MKFTEEEFEGLLSAILRTWDSKFDPKSKFSLDIQSFESAGVLTTNRGLVVKIGDSEFQLPIIQKK